MWSPVDKIILYGTLFNSLRMLVGAISAAYLITKGLNFQDVAYIKGFQAATIFLLDIPLAYYADKKSRKYSVILAVFFSILWLFQMGLGYEKYHFYIAEFFNAISLALISGAFTSYLIDERSISDKQSIKEILGKSSKYQFLGMGIAALIGSAFIKVDSEIIWIISAILISVQLITLSWILPEDNSNAKSEDKLSFYFETFEITKNIFYKMNIKWYFLGLFFIIVHYQVFIQFWQLILYENESTLSQEGIYYGIIFALILFVQSFSGYIIEKISEDIINKIIYIFSFIIIIFFLLDIKSIYIFPISIILIFFTNKLMSTLLLSKLHENINSNMRTTYSSVISTVIRLFLIIFVPFIGFIFESIGKEIFLILYIISFIGYFIVKYK